MGKFCLRTGQFMKWTLIGQNETLRTSTDSDTRLALGFSIQVYRQRLEYRCFTSQYLNKLRLLSPSLFHLLLEKTCSWDLECIDYVGQCISYRNKKNTLHQLCSFVKTRKCWRSRPGNVPQILKWL